LNLKAIGECGIDRVCGGDIEIQKDVFIKQIEISEQYNKPMIIHVVRSHSDILSIRKETKAKMPWIIHGFQGNEQIVTQYLRHNIYLSLGDVLFKNESRAAELLKFIPSERLFLETDDSDRSIAEVYEKASVLSGRSLDDMRSDIFNNFVKIFGKI
jgi:TatD DNase family protein